MTTNKDASGEAHSGGVESPEIPGAIDGAVLDRIAANLLGAIPGIAVPDPRAVGIPDLAGVDRSTGSEVSPNAGVSSAATVGGPATINGIDAARIGNPTRLPSSSAPPVSALPFDDSSLRQALLGGPKAFAAAAFQSGLSAPLEAEANSKLPPHFTTAPLDLEILDGSMPRLFDESGIYARESTNAPAGYYFLNPALPARQVPGAPAQFRRIFDVNDIRRDFPILQERVHGRQLVWLDNAATTQKPRAVIDRLVYYYEHEYSNVHRGAHTLAARSTQAYEDAREKLQRFIGAGSPDEIVFVRGTTEAINLVANSFGRRHLTAGDEIVVSTLEHHSNIVPWQFLAKQVGAVIRVVPVTDRGEVLLSDFERTLSPRTRFVALTHVSNALGTILPVAEMIQIAHRHGAHILVDGAQAVSHFPVKVQELDADFYVLSGHKMFGPSAIGVLYGKKALLSEMPPWQGGGNMIQRVTFENSTFADPPARFEAGTAALGPAVGLGAAAEYLERIGMHNVAAHEHELLAYATDALRRIPGVRLIGTAPEKASVVSFVTDEIPAEQMGKILDEEGIAVRAGHHCAQPTMDRFGLEATVRPSLALYNTHEEIDRLARAVRRALHR